MGEAKNKPTSITISLSQAELIGTKILLDKVVRCGHCGVTMLAGENRQQIKRQDEIYDALGLDEFENLAPPEVERMATQSDGAKDFDLKIDAARYLLEQVDRKARHFFMAHVLGWISSKLKAALPKSAAEMDAEATAPEPAKVAVYDLPISLKERETIVQAFQSPQQCLKCGTPTDGPGDADALKKHAACFERLRLMEFFGKTRPEVEALPAAGIYQLDLHECGYLFDLLGRRVGQVERGARRLGKFLDVLESIKNGTYQAAAPQNGVQAEQAPAAQ